MVGLAAAQAHLAAKYNRPGYEIFNNYTYCIVGDGCLQEGVAAEAISLAGYVFKKLGSSSNLLNLLYVCVDIGNLVKSLFFTTPTISRSMVRSPCLSLKTS